MALHKFSFKNLRSSNNSRRQTATPDPPHISAPTPLVPLDMNRLRAYDQRRPESSSRTPNFLEPVDTRHTAHSAHERGSDILPSSPSFDSDDEELNGELLPSVYDFAPQSARNSTKATTAQNSKDVQQETVFENRSGQGQLEEAPDRRPPSPPSVDPSRASSISTNHSMAFVRHKNDNGQDAVPMPRRQAPLIIAPSHESEYSSSPETKLMSSQDSIRSFETRASSFRSSSNLPPLQTKSAFADGDHLEPLMEDDPVSFDLVLPGDEGQEGFQLEDRSELMFSREHLLEIFKETPLLLQFTNFLSSKRPGSIPLLVYYLDALKALRAIAYVNAVAAALTPINDYDFSSHPARPTINSVLEEKARLAFDALVKDDLPAFITFTFIRVVSLSIQRRIIGTLPAHLREASEGLAEVFCLTDPSRKDNPIVFASEEFHRTTQYGVNYAIGRNCRFLQGPRTNKNSVERLMKMIQEEREISEVFLNYRRDGSPFMNLLMVAPLLDYKGKTRYFIGAQVDVSGLCKDCTDLPALQRLVAIQDPSYQNNQNGSPVEQEDEEKDSFQELSEMFNETELGMVRKHGGKMHREQIDEIEDGKRSDRPRLLIKELSDPMHKSTNDLGSRNGRLEGIYQNYLLVRPYPSLRILFCSPTLRVPGLLQSPFMSRIGGSQRIRETLTAALADGRGVTAKVRWLSGRNSDEEGRARWIHCTPLLGQNGTVGVWMVVLVEDDTTAPVRRFRQPPPVSSEIGGSRSSSKKYDAAIFGTTSRRRTSQDATYRGMDSPSYRPGTGYNSVAGGSLESFTIG